MKCFFAILVGFSLMFGGCAHKIPPPISPPATVISTAVDTQPVEKSLVDIKTSSAKAKSHASNAQVSVKLADDEAKALEEKVSAEFKAQISLLRANLSNADIALNMAQDDLDKANIATGLAEQETAKVKADAAVEHNELVARTTSYNVSVQKEQTTRNLYDDAQIQITKKDDVIAEWKVWAWRWGLAFGGLSVLIVLCLIFKSKIPFL